MTPRIPFQRASGSDREVETVDAVRNDDPGSADDGDEAASPLLGRKSVLMGMAASVGVVVANAAQPSALAAVKPIAAVTLPYAPIWTPSPALGPRGVFPSPPADLNFISTFQPGHGYTKWNGGGTVNLNNTSDFAMGSQCVTLTSPGTGSGFVSIAKWNAAPVDITKRHFAMLVKINDPTHLENVTLLLGDTVFANSYGVIAHRGDPFGRSQNAGEWTWLYFTQADFTTTTGAPRLSNIRSVQIQLNETAGAGFPVVMQIQAFGTFVPKASSTPGGAAAFPNGVITFTADDSYLSQFTLMAPRLDKFGYPANIMVITDNLDIPASNAMTLAHLEQMRDTRLYEICGHAYSGANHARGYTNISPAACELELRNLKAWLLDHGFHRGADFLAWPLGLHNATAEKIARQYFRLGRGTQGLPYLSPRIDQPMNIRAFGISPPETVATMSARIDVAFENGVWLILNVHDLTTLTTGLGPTQWNANDFAILLDYINSKGMPVRTIGQVVQSLG